MKNLFQTLMLVSLVGICLLFPNIASACTCHEDFTPPCAAYWRADAVLIGTVHEIVTVQEGSKANPPQASVHFQVEKSFKGLSNMQVAIDVPLDSCYYGYGLKIGEKYIVYAYRNAVTGKLELRPCSRIGLLNDSADDLNYIDQLIQKKTPQSISGMLSGRFDKNDLSDAKVVVTGNQVKIESPFDALARYSINLPRAGTFHVKLILPFEAKFMSGPDVKVISQSSQTSLEYTINLVENQCDYREVRVSKCESAAISAVGVKENSCH